MYKFKPPEEIQNLLRLKGVSFDNLPKNIIHEVSQGLLKFYKTENPAVSIIMIAHNEEPIIFPALASIAKLEPNCNVEFILVSNNSTDGTNKIAIELGVNLIKEPRQGWGYARNAGLNAAKADVILTCDGDNLYPPTWVQELAGPLLKDKDLSVVCSQYCFYSAAQHYPISLQIYQWTRQLHYKTRHSKRPHLNCLGGSMAFRKKQALAVGGYENTGRGEDGKLAFELAKLGRIRFKISRASFCFADITRSIPDSRVGKAFKNRLARNLKSFGQFFTKQKQE